MAQGPESGDQEQGRTHSRARPGPAIGLALALVASLALNGVTASRLREREDEIADLRARLAAAQKSLSDLRTEVRGAGPSDPLAKIAAAVEKLRGLAFKRPVEPELLTAARFKDRVHELFLRDTKRAEIDANAKVLEQLGVLPAGLDLYGMLVALQEEQIAGFYDSTTKRLVVRATNAKNPSPLDRVLLAHEYTHALTDQYYDLSRLDVLNEKRKDDEATAFLALIEGDAQYTMRLYQQNVLTAEEQTQLLKEFQDVPMDQLDRSPQFLQNALSFPYTEGLDFVSVLHDRGGFGEVDQAYQDPPVSTEQILHPARYLDRRDNPVAVSLPDLVRALGRGWHRLDEGGFGEEDLREVVDLGGGTGLSSADARRVAGGWDGGRYLGVESGDSVLVAVLAVWDSEIEAREAGRLLGRWLPLRYKNIGSELPIGKGSGRGWQSKGGAGEVLRNGSRVLILLGPTAADVETARAAFDGF